MSGGWQNEGFQSIKIVNEDGYNYNEWSNLPWYQRMFSSNPNYSGSSGALEFVSGPGEVKLIAYLSKALNFSKQAKGANALLKGVEGGSRIFEVGAYKSLKGVEAGLQAHHVGQKALMSKFIPGYNWRTAPSILVPEVGHTLGSGVLSRGTSGFLNARQVLARDIFELRRVYPNVPNSSLQQLIQMNKSIYPGAFIK